MTYLIVANKSPIFFLFFFPGEAIFSSFFFLVLCVSSDEEGRLFGKFMPPWNFFSLLIFFVWMSRK